MPGKGQYKLTEELFWQTLREKGFTLDHSVELSSPYRGALTKVVVHCATYGEHETIAGDVARNQHGCPSCAIAHRAALRAARPRGIPNRALQKPLDTFLASLSLPSRVVVTDCTKYESITSGEVTTRCELHGEATWSPPVALRRAKHACRACAQNVRISMRRNSWDDFIARARVIFGERFGYVDAHGYQTLRSKVDIVCKIHGVQTMPAGKHLIHGQYCAHCRLADLRASGKLVGHVGDALARDPELGKTPARLYYVRLGRLYKIGISWAKDPKTRFRALRRSSGCEVEVLQLVECSLGEAFAREQAILKTYAEHRVARSWSTELFDRDVLQQRRLLEESSGP